MTSYKGNAIASRLQQVICCPQKQNRRTAHKLLVCFMHLLTPHDQVKWFETIGLSASKYRAANFQAFLIKISIDFQAGFKRRRQSTAQMAEW